MGGSGGMVYTADLKSSGSVIDPAGSIPAFRTTRVRGRLIEIESLFYGGIISINKVIKGRYQLVEIGLTNLALKIGTWCNGNTTVFGAVVLSSNLGVPTPSYLQY